MRNQKMKSMSLGMLMLFGFSSNAEIVARAEIRLAHHLTFARPTAGPGQTVFLSAHNSIRGTAQLSGTIADRCVSFGGTGHINLHSEIPMNEVKVAVDRFDGRPNLTFIEIDPSQTLPDLLFAVVDPKAPFAAAESVFDSTVGVYMHIKRQQYQAQFAEILAHQFPGARKAEDWELQEHLGTLVPLTCTWSDTETQIDCNAEVELVLEAHSKADETLKASGLSEDSVLQE